MRQYQSTDLEREYIMSPQYQALMNKRSEFLRDFLWYDVSAIVRSVFGFDSLPPE